MNTLDTEKLACPICTDILSNAIETSCGHAFCEHCLNQCLEVKPNICPVCHKNPSPVHPSYLLRSLCDSLISLQKPDSDSGSATTEKNLGNDCYNQKKYADAIAHYNNAIDRTPKDALERAVIHNNRAQCYIQLQQYHRALIDLEDCIRLNPAGEIKVKATIRKAMCLGKLGDFRASRATYQTALQMDKTKKFRETVIHALKSLPPDIAATPPAPAQQPRRPATVNQPQVPLAQNRNRSQQNSQQYYDNANSSYPAFVQYQYGPPPTHNSPGPIRNSPVLRAPAPQPCRNASAREERRRKRHHHHGECSIQ